MAHKNLITVNKLNPTLGRWGGDGGGVILPPLPVGIPLITQKQ